MTWRGKPLKQLLPLLTGVLLLLITAATAALVAARQQEASAAVRRTLEVAERLERIQTLVTDAESGQRGFLLTGRIEYLEPYVLARQNVGPELDQLGVEIAAEHTEAKILLSLRGLVGDKFAELQKTVDLRQAGRSDQALAVVNNDSGVRFMASIRQAIDALRGKESVLLDQRSATADTLSALGQAILASSCLLIIAVGAFALRDSRKRIVELEGVNARLEIEGLERRAAEAQLRQLQKMEAVGQLTGGIAHDFNNMLAIVIGFLELARRRVDATNQALLKYIDGATDGANRAVLLTQRLLAFSRLQPLEPAVLNQINWSLACLSCCAAP